MVLLLTIDYWLLVPLLAIPFGVIAAPCGPGADGDASG